MATMSEVLQLVAFGLAVGVAWKATDLLLGPTLDRAGLWLRDRLVGHRRGASRETVLPVIDAWTEPGSERQSALRGMLRHEWPALAAALDDLYVSTDTGAEKGAPMPDHGPER
jgi:hypothetical protein